LNISTSEKPVQNDSPYTCIQLVNSDCCGHIFTHWPSDAYTFGSAPTCQNDRSTHWSLDSLPTWMLCTYISWL